MLTSFFNKLSITNSSVIVFLTLGGLIVLSIFCLNNNSNNSFAIQTDISNNKNEFNIITAADFGCSLRAQENIKNIEKMNPELVLVPGDLSYKKTAACWINMTKPLESKIKIAMGNQLLLIAHCSFFNATTHYSSYYQLHWFSHRFHWCIAFFYQGYYCKKSFCGYPH